MLGIGVRFRVVIGLFGTALFSLTLFSFPSTFPCEMLGSVIHRLYILYVHVHQIYSVKTASKTYIHNGPPPRVPMIQWVDVGAHILHKRRHFGVPDKTVRCYRFQIWKSDVFTVAEQTALWVVLCSSLHESHEGASHNPVCAQPAPGRIQASWPWCGSPHQLSRAGNGY